jgi:hypothetical protein
LYDPRYQDAVKVAAVRIKKVSRLTWGDDEAQFLRPARKPCASKVGGVVGSPDESPLPQYVAVELRDPAFDDFLIRKRSILTIT